MRFAGVLTALVTPFADDGRVDEAAFRALVQRQVEGGVHGLVPCGTTGEAPTLDHDEHLQVIRWTVEEAAGKVPVMAGIGSNDTRTALINGRRAIDAGADGLLATTPYYNKPTQRGILHHFRTLADALDTQICLYDVPGRTGVSCAASTLLALAHHPRITTLKDATGDLAHASRVLRHVRPFHPDEGPDADTTRPPLTVLSGDDFTTLAHMAVGGSGCISVASNVAPGHMVKLYDAAQAGRWDEARAIHEALFPLFEALFMVTNPLPVKTALAHLGLCKEVFRSPLVPMELAARGTLVDVVDQYR